MKHRKAAKWSTAQCDSCRLPLGEFRDGQHHGSLSMPFVELRPVRWKRLAQVLPQTLAQVRVDSSRFLELLISNRQLTQADAPDAGLCGLIDQEDGAWYMTDQKELACRPR
jgi:hypothetical protein